jgi:hypothetical protein
MSGKYFKFNKFKSTNLRTISHTIRNAADGALLTKTIFCINYVASAAFLILSKICESFCDVYCSDMQSWADYFKKVTSVNWSVEWVELSAES